MRTFCLITLCFLLVRVVYSQTSETTVKSYDVKVAVSKTSEFMDVSLKCNIMVNANNGMLCFLLNQESKVSSISYLRGSEWFSLPFKFTGRDSLLIFPADSLTSGNLYSLRFEYSLPAGMLSDTIMVFDRGNRWYPMIVDQVAPFRIEALAPEEYLVLSAGDPISSYTKENFTSYVWESRTPVFKLPLIILNSNVIKLKQINYKGVNISMYYMTADSAASDILALSEEAFGYFETAFGNYPYKSLRFVEIPYFEGINTGSGIIMLGTRSINDIAKGFSDGLYLSIAQQWIGAGVFAKYGTPGFWLLSLSLPHYLRLMYIRHAWGEELYNKSLRDPLQNYMEFAGKERDIPLIDITIPDSREKGIVLYAKGPYVFGRIERQLGADKWSGFIRNLCSICRGKTLTFEEFKNLLSAYDENGNTLNLLQKLVTGIGIEME
ncbi:MAG TPA: hypothetical protein VHO03_20950 [Ignavibacteriales bacterium]|nr:hypothetical protein [Ignavibacteriales bacterium]